jgi:hypothetical protein
MQSIAQRTVMQGPRQLGTGFSFAIWVGTVGGAALAADPLPNTTPPSAGRILRQGAKRGASMISSQGVVRTVSVPIAGGTTTFQLWMYDDGAALWFPYAATVVVVANGVASNTNFGTTVATRINQQFFVQIVANTNVQAFAWDMA